MLNNYFHYLSPSQLEKIIKENPIVYLPLGSLEWHERHLPFGVDGFIAQAICEGACRHTGGCIIPTQYFGTDTVYRENGNEYRGMNEAAKRVLPGSIYPIDQNLFNTFLEQIIENILQQGFRKIVLVSGHCEPAQMKVVNGIYKEYKDRGVIAFPREDIFFEGNLDHAGEIETSLMLAINSELVQLDKLSKPYEALIGEDPLNATEEAGEKQLRKIINQLVSLIEE